jgi:CheY-like chemotaxis protein
MIADEKVYAHALTGVRVLVVEEALIDFRPDVILSDLKMPETDGLSFVRRLRQAQALQAIPVLAVTGFHELYDLRELCDAGFLGVMRKPVIFTDLIQTIGAIAQARKSASDSDRAMH